MVLRFFGGVISGVAAFARRGVLATIVLTNGDVDGQRGVRLCDLTIALRSDNTGLLAFRTCASYFQVFSMPALCVVPGIAAIKTTGPRAADDDEDDLVDPLPADADPFVNEDEIDELTVEEFDEEFDADFDEEDAELKQFEEQLAGDDGLDSDDDEDDEGSIDGDFEEEDF